MIIYRILSFIVSFFCAFIAVNVLFSIFLALTQPMLLIMSFILICVVLYGWFANRFYANIVVLKKMMTKRQKDLIQVNAIVAFIFSAVCVLGGIQILLQPQLLDDALKSLPKDIAMPSEGIKKGMIVFLIFCSVLFVHIIWTYFLIRKHKDYFEA
ncbi:hypothetical protein BH10BAC2_BH10BAC2_10460 [soil metagenome]